MLDVYGLAAVHLQLLRRENGHQWSEDDVLWFDPERGVIARLRAGLRWLRDGLRPRVEADCARRDVCTAR